jgi:hypothetical protein
MCCNGVDRENFLVIYNKMAGKNANLYGGSDTNAICCKVLK